MTPNRIILASTVLVAVVAVGVGATAGASRVSEWKGAESLAQTGLAPNVKRCGAPPFNLEGRFTGTGIDTAGGPFAVAASGCLNVQTLRVSDLKATDTYLRNGDSVRIASDDFTLTLEPRTCVASNRRPITFEVVGGTGTLAGATGHGRFDIAMNWTPCSGLILPAHVWFDGDFEAPR